MKTIVVCGSEKFENEMLKFRDEERAKGNRVLLPDYLEVPVTSDDESTRNRILSIRRNRIELADSLFVWNKGGKIEESMKYEIYYTAQCHKPIEYLEESGRIPILTDAERERIGELVSRLANDFRWQFTEEGYVFWDNIYVRLRRLKLQGY